MIKTLNVKNFLLFGDVEVEFNRGFNVITGETGAGKSLIVNAIQMAVSPRVEWSEINGDLYIEITFFEDEDLKSELEELGLDCEGEVVLRRKFDASGKRVKTFINDFLVSSRKVWEIFSKYVFVGHQFSQRDILNTKFQTKMFDRGIGISINTYTEMYSRYISQNTKYRGVLNELKNLAGKEDYINYQLRELEKIDYDVDEEMLIQEKSRLENALQSIEWASTFSRYYDDIYPRISELLKTSPEKFKPIFEEILERLNEVRLSLDISDTEEIVSRIDEINSKLFIIGRLKAKFGTDFQGLKSVREKLRGDINRLNLLREEVSRMEREVEEVKKKVYGMAEELNTLRYKKKGDFEKMFEKFLKSLGFDYVKVEVVLRERDIWERGSTEVEIKISTIPSVNPSSVDNLSGGELSRVALAMFHLGGTYYRSMILDEIDMGVSPQIALQIGKTLRRISRETQIISITHQPFTALYCDKHFVVEKTNPSKATIREIYGEERLKELARMMGVEDISVVKDLFQP